MRMKEKAGYAMGRELRAMFPEQTKSIPALLIWTVIYRWMWRSWAGCASSWAWICLEAPITPG